MTIRNADVGHLDAIADLAQDLRIRQQAWAPDFWALAPNAREVHPLLLRWTIDGGRAISLVATSDTGVDGYAISTPLPSIDGRMCHWVIDEFAVASPTSWRTLGRALLAAVAARAVTQGASRLIAPCAVADTARRSAFAAAGLDVGCWYRHVRLDSAPLPATDELADGDSGLPLPHLHSLTPLLRGAVGVAAPGAHGLLSPSIPAPAVHRVGGTTGLLDPLIGTDAASMVAAIEGAERICRQRGDVALMVAVGPGEEPLDAMLDRRGYSKPVEWWTLRVR